MNNDLVERYIYAVTKKMSPQQKKDVSDELRTLIEDMLDERCGDVLPTNKDITIVLTELGTPRDLYEKYDTNSKKCLIGAPHYTTYKLVLKIVLICVCFGMVVAGVVTQLTSPQDVWYIGIFEWFATAISSLLTAFACVTLIFACLYYKDVNIDPIIDIKDLPPVPKKSQLISKGECIFGIAISAAFVFVFLVCPQIIGAKLSSGEYIPLFNLNVVKNTWFIIVAMGVIGILKDAVKLIEGQYNNKVMVTSIAEDVISAILTIFWLLQDNLINPKFIEFISSIDVKNNEIVTFIFSNFQHFFIGMILLALVIDVITVIVKTYKAEK